MTSPSPREVLPQAPADILQVLPAMGRVMLSARGGGATHERIGAVDTVTITAAGARLSGESHDSLLNLDTIARIVADRTGRMRDKVLPRLECQDAAGETQYSLIALDGIEGFDSALLVLGAGEALVPVEKPAPGAGASAPDIPADDLGNATFAAIRETGIAITIELRRPGLRQSWLGVPPEVKPAMGFVNVMQGDFHLHLKAGAVAAWERRAIGELTELHARDETGEAFGLVLIGPAVAFAGVPTSTVA